MNNYDPANNGSYNYGNVPTYNTSNGNSNWNMPRTYPPYTQQPRLITNKSYVTSLEEALLKTTERNSDMIHFHQDKNEFYCVKVDMEGKKTWAVFTYNIPNPDDNAPATKADLQGLVARIEALEAQKDTKSSTRRKKEVNENVESDGQRTVFTFDSE